MEKKDRIGVALSFRSLLPGTDVGSEEYLNELRDRGVRSVELRHVGKPEPEDIMKAVTRVWNSGLRVTVHSDVRGEETAYSEVMEPLRDLIRTDKQDHIIIVLHPCGAPDYYEANCRLMEKLTDNARKNDLRLRFALENNRFLPDRTEGDCVGLVSRVISHFDPEYAGITFDFGHYAWNTRVWEKEPVMPPRAFLDRVIQTHIHALSGPEKKYTTHFPLQIGSLPLADYIEALGPNYSGLYNLELDPRRYEDLCGSAESILGSVEALKKVL